MGEVVVTRGSVAIPDTVWRVLADLDHAASTISAIERIERLQADAFPVGTPWREAAAMLVRTAMRY